ncbi:hypothetical protein [Sedimentitalea nanhaiensis]|uniref:Uncharacterized protein n=1 Tax=Sedimentitalea nanhaiensis TaxID=999627 RepID=A0A1I7D5E2_9RHOB|nr:hypothetical protein [Sedimentitalea nanhaiensis]SFU06909.1 hypothetical protein SAMN05216236_12317 [Sedimentitalea nanhaiensis]
MSSTNQDTKHPPANVLRVTGWKDLPTDRTPALYRVTGSNGDSREFTLAKGNRVILDALLRQPIYCASPVRVSDRVCVLRREYGVPITIEMYENDAATDRAKFGVYFIGEGVARIGGAA